MQIVHPVAEPGVEELPAAVPYGLAHRPALEHPGVKLDGKTAGRLVVDEPVGAYELHDVAQVEPFGEAGVPGAALAAASDRRFAGVRGARAPSAHPARVAG